jgi:prevent-host-death family protein
MTFRSLAGPPADRRAFTLVWASVVARLVLHAPVMTKTLTLREANQSFAQRIREVEAGEEFVITRNGTPVARLSPISKHRVLTPEQQAAWERLSAAMEKGWDIGAGPLDRDALHER